jgi:hypothetical protein
MGLAVGVAAAAAYAIASFLVPHLVPAIAGAFVAAAWFAFPVSLALAVLRYRLFEVDRVVRASITWGLFAALLLVGYLVLVVVVGRTATTFFGASLDRVDDPTVAVLAALVIAGIAHPVRKRLLSGLEARVYKHRFARIRLTDRAARLLSAPQSPAEVAIFLCQDVPTSLDLTGCWLAVPADNAPLFEVERGALIPNVSVASTALLGALRDLDTAVLLARPEDLDAHAPLASLSRETPGLKPWFTTGGRIV